MKIVRDEPHRRLELAETQPRLPLSGALVVFVLLLLVTTPWSGLWAMLVHGAGREALDLVGSGIWFAVGLSCLLGVLGGRRLERLAADRETSRIDWRSSYLAGLVHWSGSQSSEGLERLTLGIVPGPRAAAGAHALPLRLTLRSLEGQRARDKSIDLRVEAVNRADEVADLALRLGAAAGLRFYRVLENELSRFEIELRREAGPGFATVPAALGRADPERDAVSPAAAAAASQERLRRFEPAGFRGSARVSVWEPGREIRFEKGWGASVLLAPLLLFALLGPLAFFRLPSLHTMPLLPRVVTLVLITLVGLALALAGWVGVSSGLPRRVRLDWGTRTLDVETLRERRAIPFTEIAAIELRHHVYRTNTTRGRLPRVYFSTQVWAARLPATAPGEILVETRSSRDDADTPRAMALPLAVELAAALGVERREARSEKS
jgi:hypothetical protein